MAVTKRYQYPTQAGLIIFVERFSAKPSRLKIRSFTMQYADFETRFFIQSLLKKEDKKRRGFTLNVGAYAVMTLF